MTKEIAEQLNEYGQSLHNLLVELPDHPAITDTAVANDSTATTRSLARFGSQIQDLPLVYCCRPLN
jgi:hypothetical protein